MPTQIDRRADARSRPRHALRGRQPIERAERRQRSRGEAAALARPKARRDHAAAGGSVGQQQRRDRPHHPIGRPALRFDRLGGGARHRPQPPRIGEQPEQDRRQFVGVGDRRRAAGLVEQREDIDEIGDARSVQDRAAELRRLDRVLAAFADKRLAGQHDAGEAVEQSELAERVANVDFDAALRPLAARAHSASQAERPEFVGDRRAALGMARRDQRQHVGKDLGDTAMRLGGDALFAGVGRGGDPDLPPGDAASEFGELLLVGGRRRGVVFEIADDVDLRRAERSKPLRIGLALRQAEIKSPEQRADEGGSAQPALVGARAHPRVHHRQRRAGAPRFQDHVRPDLGFGDQSEVGPPMVEEAPHEARRVERRELVQRDAAAGVAPAAAPK